MTQVLVTGAAGFIGSHLCESLLRRGHTVRGLDAFTTFYDPDRKRAQRSRRCSRDPRFELIVGRPAHRPSRRGARRRRRRGPPRRRAGRLELLGSELPAVRRPERPRHPATARGSDASTASSRLVYASSSSVYGTGADTLRAAGEPRPASPYGVTKLAAETLVGAYARHRPVRRVACATSPCTARASVPTWPPTASSSPARRPSADGLRRRPAGTRLHLRRRHRRGHGAGASSPMFRPVPCSTWRAAGRRR